MDCEWGRLGLHAVHRRAGNAHGLHGGGSGLLHGVNLHGATADERPLVAIKDPVTITDMHATIFSAMGINPKTAYDVEQRPFYATIDGKGKPVDSIFS